ncbi:OmpA family protein [Brachybacterium sp. DNPG3]
MTVLRTVRARRTLADRRVPADRRASAVGRLLAGSSALLMLVLTASPALADGEAEGPPEQPFEITQEVIDKSITVYDPADSITVYDPAASVTVLGSAEPAEDEVIVLEADILFSSNAWDLSDGAADRIAELAAAIPERATVQVGGHTDSLPVDRSRYDFDNRELSEHRAQAVADALAAERPDLTLEVTGYGSEQLAVPESADVPSTLAANRRVELRYGD